MPTAPRRRAQHAPRAGATAHCGDATFEQAIQRQGPGNGSAAVQSPAHDARRTNDTNTTAFAALVTTQHDLCKFRRSRRRRGPPLLATSNPVAMQGKFFPGHLARRAAPWAVAWPHAGHRWQRLLPHLDVHAAWYKPLIALVSLVQV